MAADLSSLVLLCFVAASGQAAEGGTVVMDLSQADVACERFMGFGAEWDSAGYDVSGVTDEDFAVIAERVRWMRLPVARTMMLTRWCYRGEAGFDWDNRDMQCLCRQLDLCQQEGITVLLTDWGCESWTKVPGIENMVDPKYAEAVGEYMDYFLNRRGYSCIKFFILVNEPNYEVGDWERWKQGVRMVAEVFKRRGLDKQVVFAGPDHSNAPAWQYQAVDQLRDVLGAYDVHAYASDAVVRPGGLEDFFAGQWRYALEHDPAAKGKPFIVGEAGLNDFAKHPAGNEKIDSFYYGLFMADYAVQAARAGSAAVCAWQLDDNGHEGFSWGLWSDKNGGLRVRQWFYPWSLLSRYFPPGATVYRPEQPSPDGRVLAASAPLGDDLAWTFCLVNRGDTEARTIVRTPAGRAASLKRYLYSPDEAAVDDKGFPAPVAVEDADFGKGLELRCPAGSVVLATTLPW